MTFPPSGDVFVFMISRHLGLINIHTARVLFSGPRSYVERTPRNARFRKNNNNNNKRTADMLGGGRGRCVCVPLARAICHVRKSICIIRNSFASTTPRNVTPLQILDDESTYIRESTAGLSFWESIAVDLSRIERSFFGGLGYFVCLFSVTKLIQNEFPDYTCTHQTTVRCLPTDM